LPAWRKRHIQQFKIGGCVGLLLFAFRTLHRCLPCGISPVDYFSRIRRLIPFYDKVNPAMRILAGLLRLGVGTPGKLKIGQSKSV
jgi:hypothetical protein